MSGKALKTVLSLVETTTEDRCMRQPRKEQKVPEITQIPLGQQHQVQAGTTSRGFL